METISKDCAAHRPYILLAEFRVMASGDHQHEKLLLLR